MGADDGRFGDWCWNSKVCMDAMASFCIRWWRVLTETGADRGSPERVMVFPSCWKDILGTEKSAMMDPKEPSQCMPKTTSAPSIGSTKKE